MSLLAYSYASGIMLIALAAVYMLMMRNTTNFGLNRACLIAIMAVSLVAPFISLPTLAAAGGATTEVGNLSLTAVNADTAVKPNHHTLLKIIGFIYLIGVAVVAARTIANFCFVVCLRWNSRVEMIGGHKVRVHTHKRIPPMSWGGEIYIADNVARGDDREAEMILAHEEAHRRHGHWLDLVLSNAVTAINWYNPAAWMLQCELIAVHEYEADKIASQQSLDLIDYQLLLITKTAGTRLQTFADSLNQSSLKKRITMMMKKQSKGSSRLRSFALIPAMALAFIGSNSSCVKAAQQEASAYEPVEQLTDATDDNSKTAPLELDETVVVAFGSNETPQTKAIEIVKQPEYPGGTIALYKRIADTINFVGDVNETGKVIVGFTIDAEGNLVNPHIIKGLSEAKNEETLRMIKMLDQKWQPAETKDGEKVSAEYTLPVIFKTAPAKK